MKRWLRRPRVALLSLLGASGFFVFACNREQSVDESSTTPDVIDECVSTLAPFPLFSGVATESDGEYFQATRQGDLLHFDGTRWSRVELDEPQVQDIWAASGNDVFVAGYTKLVHYNGRSFEPELSWSFELTTFEGIWGVSSRDVWAVGNTSPGCSDCNAPFTIHVAHFDGVDWNERVTGLEGNATDIWGTADDLWISGSSLWHFDGETWSEAGLPELSRTSRFLGKSPSTAYLTDGTALLRFDGSGWTELDTSGYRIDSLAQDTTGEVYATTRDEPGVLLQQEGNSFVEIPGVDVGANPTLAPFDGDLLAIEATRISRLTPDGLESWVNTFDTGTFEAVWSDGEGAVAALRGGALLRVDEQARVLADLGDDQDRHALDGLSIDDLWVVALLGTAELAYHWDGASLTPIALPGQDRLSLSDVYVAANGEAWAVGWYARPENEPASGAFLFRLDTVPPTEVDVGDRFEELHHIAGSGEQIYLADFARVALWQDGTLEHLPEPGGEILELGVVAENDAYVIARVSRNRSDVLHWDGSSWSSIDAISGMAWRFLDVSGPRDIWVSAAADANETRLAHYDGTVWTLMEDLPELGTVRPLKSLPDELMLVGYYESWSYSCVP